MRGRAPLGWLLGAALGSWFAACAGPGAFLCSSDIECVASGVQGQCEPTGYCSFPNDDCESGFGYPSDAGEGLAGTCVDPAVVGTDDTGGNGNDADADDDDDDDFVTGDSGDDDDDDDAVPDGDDDDDVGPLPECGNGLVEAGEQCEPDLPAQPCSIAGFSGGTLGCTSDCQWDTNQCSTCGDNQVGAGETCDGADLDGLSCESEGFIAGELGCTADCQSVDTSACTNCGNGVVDFDEPCDGLELGGQSCGGLGYIDGAPACNDTCDYFDTSMCTGVECGFDPDPVGPCAPECNACEDGRCDIDCAGGGACAGEDIVCPPGSSCRVDCSGGGACEGATVICPPYFECRVDCSGGGACDDLVLQCGDVGSCRLNCENGTACGGALVQCGLDECEAECATQTPVLMECSPVGCGCTNNC